MRAIAVIQMAAVMVTLAAGCSDDRPVNIPLVPAGAYEADCQRLCTLTAGDDGCTAKHAEFCVATCRARTNGLPAACATCLIAAGSTIASEVDGFGDRYCLVGGPADVTACRDECDDGGGAPAPELASYCELTCAFYMQDVTPLACSDDGAAACRSECATAIAGHGRICAQCLIEQTSPSRICINDACDCEPFFNSDSSFSCMQLCDSLPPP